MSLSIRVIIVLLLAAPLSVAAKTISKKEFIAMAFTDTKSQPKPETLWLNDDLQAKATAILDHRYPKLRLRYWLDPANKQTVWFLDEIGKERPISFGISVINDRVDLIKVLAFRESRGGEIRMASFTEQFNNIGITDDTGLNRTIDGITGATMSVIAMKKITRLALVLHKEVLR